MYSSTAPTAISIPIGLSESQRFHDRDSLPQISIMGNTGSLTKLIKHPGFILGFCIVYSTWISLSDPPAVKEARQQRRLQGKQEEQQQTMQALKRKEGVETVATQKEISSEQPWDR